MTSKGNAPFYLHAEIVETTNPKSNYRGEIEEFWVSPEKWRRTIKSPDFSQTLTENGENTSEEDTGDYFPWWLHDLLDAIFNPLPMLDTLKAVDAKMPKPSGSEISSVCSRMQMKIGVPPAQNTAFLVFCFDGRALLKSVVTPGYQAEFDDYRTFQEKTVARRFTLDPEPGTTIEAKITELRELKDPDESMFAVPRPTSAGQRITSIRVDEATARTFLKSAPDIVWPTVRSGATSGVLSMYISVDRAGHVREAWPLGSDNAGLEDIAREQVMKWQFNTAASNGVPVQMESTLTLAFDTKIGDPIPILSNDEARKLAVHTVEPTFPSGAAPTGTEVKVRIGVALDGSVNGVSNVSNARVQLFMAASAAVRQWHFGPYIHDGKQDIFGADVTFRVP